jgi:DNA-directed RNA polymerase subunit RPC12/RpoP
MASYQGLGVEFKALQEKLRAALEKRGFKIERVMTGETSFLIEYKKPGLFGAKETISVKGVPDNFTVYEVREGDEEAWFLVEDAIIASAKNPQAFRSCTETEAASTPTPPTASTTPQASLPATKTEKPQQPLPTSCSRCGAPLSVTQEDLIVTCRYCGFTITVAGRDEVKRHSMLENRLLAQQAAEAARNYMDKGLLRVGVSKDAQIASVKLRYVPFWVFSADADTSFSGTTGAGVMGEIRQAQEAIGDKKAGALSKFGRLVAVGASAYMESQQKDRRPRTVSYSFSNHYVWPAMARRTMISEINYYDVPAVKKVPFDAGKVPQDAEFLNTELGEEEAKAMVKSEVEAKERLIASGRVDTLESCKVNIVLGEAELVHAPVWFVHYTLKGENYVIVVDGSDGKALGGGRPLFKIT